MQIDTKSLSGQSIISIEKKDHTWFFLLSGGDFIATESPWRFVTEKGILVASEDHGQQFGLPASVDAGEQTFDALTCSNIVNLLHDPKTGDLVVTFPGDRCLQFLQLSCGYEAWRLYMGDFEYVCMGGGVCVSLERNHFINNKTANKSAKAIK